MPGASQLRVQVWDYDTVLSDELIGETIIDLENRFFSKKWRKLINPPVETRELFQPLSSLSRGKIELFLEIIPTENIDLMNRIFEIHPKPTAVF